MIEISKADWKLYRERVVVWQENYMEKLDFAGLCIGTLLGA